MSWLAVTLELDAALAEPFSEALLEAGAESVWLENPTAERNTVNALLAAGSAPDAVVAAACEHCGLGAQPAFSVSVVEDADWVRRTQAQFAPLRIGERLWIVPSWHEPPRAAAVVRLDPGMAFGTGSHPTTRLALRFLERSVAGGESVLDYGCGSGILAIAAAKLGAGRIGATDIDSGAVQTAAANARANGVALAPCLPDELSPGLYDIVVANILAQPLIMLAPLLAALSAPRGRIALSGILQPQAAEVAAAYAPWFEFGAGAEEEGWSLLEGLKR